MERAQAESILVSRGWLAEQPASVQAEVLRRGDLAPFAKGDWLHRVGDGPGPFYGVVAGSFGTYVGGPQRGPDLTHILRVGWWFGEGPTLGGQARLLGVRAMEESFAWRVPLEAARDLVRDPLAAQSVGRISVDAMRIAAVNVSDLLIRRTDRRVAAVLLRAAGAIERGVMRPTGDVRLTQGNLAQMANASRDVVNRTLARLEDSGFVRLGYNRVAVLQPEAVAEFAFRHRP
ncbi:Crp/Fnr family transcriptional regulator [Paracraurococcus lichenis]|uniref:Crp/Fnr family transcriptional regulator n=1 Tax=Paracraurococcus lichenis TaxID=3064888 RepID=A0ABT9DTF2_9PROT|nr:Crp/Fnr family transcriptional regulator [Paracraurococcus sp. LOR1-02]MDO9707182.1 Crp/Fnr family transcriptional regulator [Paracraurococcus sp. LOR1-02]